MRITAFGLYPRKSEGKTLSEGWVALLVTLYIIHIQIIYFIYLVYLCMCLICMYKISFKMIIPIRSIKCQIQVSEVCHIVFLKITAQ